MDILQAAILGFIQGIAEFLPISSSGHLIALPKLFGWGGQGYDFDVAVHIATLFAIIYALWPDIKEMVNGFLKRKEKIETNLAVKIGVATMPVVVVGLFISGAYLDAIRTIEIVAMNLIFWGVVLWVADWYASKTKKLVEKVEKTKWRQVIVIGFAQAVALIPGTSRSGITISAGLFMGIDRRTAAKFSFLLAIPAIAGAGTFAFVDTLNNGLITPIPELLIGSLTAFISGLFAIRFLLKFLEKYSFKWFAIYRIILGAVLLLSIMF